MLKVLAEVFPPAKVPIGIADRSQKIKRALDKGDDLYKVMKGTEITGGKTLMNGVFKPGKDHEFTSAEGEKFVIKPSGEVIGGPKVTQADVDRANQQLKDAQAEWDRKREEFRKLMEEERRNNPPPKPY